MTEALRIVGVVTAEATAPFSSGVGTHNYYDLPLLLNREVTKDERARIDRGRQHQGWQVIGGSNPGAAVTSSGAGG